MNGLILMACTIVALFVGYRFYARWLEKNWGVDPNAKTPAQLKNDGNDYVPTNKWTVFSHQFTSITGAGPVTGPIIAAMFGWLPATLWMIFGCIFFGAVQDFTALYASVKNGGKSMGMMIEQYVGRTGRQLFLFFCWLFTLLVISAFCDIVANTFNGFTAQGAEIMPNAAAASISILYMFVAVAFGLYLKYRKPSGREQLIVGIVLMVLMLWIGIANPIYADAVTWRYVVFAYLFCAAVMPMWLLKQPRDYLSMFLLIGMILGGVIGVFVKNPEYAGQEDEYDFYFCDNQNHCIRCLTPDGRVTTYAGRGSASAVADNNVWGTEDGDLREVARFRDPTGLAYDEETNTFYILDTVGRKIRTISMEGENASTGDDTESSDQSNE